MVSGGVAVVVLAAGGSRRLGRPKQLEPHGGTTLLGHAVAVALEAALGPVVVVLGAEAERCRAALDAAPRTGVASVVINRAWATGLASSIREGIAECGRLPEPCDAALLMTCDQPLVDADHLRSLSRAMQASGTRIAASGYAGTIGVPAAFARSLWPELSGLAGDFGAKGVLEAHRDDVAVVPCESAAQDIDTDPGSPARLRWPHRV